MTSLGDAKKKALNKLIEAKIVDEIYELISIFSYSLGKSEIDIVIEDKEILDQAPLNKSHKKYGFIEPIKYFDPSIGISQIVGLNNHNKYAVASLKDSSVYFFEVKNNEELINLKREYIGERIRDMIKIKDGLILFLEDTASIAFINLN